MLGLRSVFELTFFKDVLADTEADKFAILDVLRSLWIDSSPLAVIISVLKSLKAKRKINTMHNPIYSIETLPKSEFAEAFSKTLGSKILPALLG